MDNHRQIQLPSQIQLGPKHCQLELEILLAKQIQAQFADGHDPGVVQGRLAHLLGGLVVPMLRIEGVNPYRIAQFGEAIGQGPDRRNF